MDTQTIRDERYFRCALLKDRARLKEIETIIRDLDSPPGENKENSDMIDTYLTVRESIKARIAIYQDILNQEYPMTANCNLITEEPS